MNGLDSVQSMQDAGFNRPEVEGWIQDKTQLLQEGGFNSVEIDQYFGKNPFNEKPVQDAVIDNLARHAASSAAPEEKDSVFNDFVTRLRSEADTPVSNLPMPKSITDGPKPLKPAAGVVDAWKAGLQVGDSGLFFNGPPDMALSPDADMYQRIANQVGLVMSDFPVMAATASAVTGALGLATGAAVPLGAAMAIGAASNAVPAFIRETMMDAYRNGEVTDFRDFWSRFAPVVIKTMKEGVVGALTMGAGNKIKAIGAGTAVEGLAGKLAQSSGAVKTSAQLAGEVATMVSVGNAIEGRVPKFSDFTDAAIVMLGLHGAIKVAESPIAREFVRDTGVRVTPEDKDAMATLMESKLHRIWAETGIDPHQVLEQAQTDPVLKQELLNDSMEVPNTYKPFIDPTIRERRIAAGINPTTGEPNNTVELGDIPAPVETVEKGIRESIKASPGDVVLYQGVRAENAEGKAGGASGWWTTDIQEAKGYADKDGPGGKINVTTDKDMPEGTFTDSEGQPVSPQEFLKTTNKVGTGLAGEENIRTTLNASEINLEETKPPSSLGSSFVKDQGGSVGLPPVKPRPVRTAAEKIVLAEIGVSPDRGSGLSLDKIYTDTVDRLYPVRKLVSELTSDKLAGIKDTYILGRLMSGHIGRVKQWIDGKGYDFTTLKNTVKGLKETLKPVMDDLDGFRAYAKSARGLEKAAQGLDPGGDLAAAQEVVNAGKEKYAPVLADLVKYQDGLIDFMAESGVLNKDSVANFKETNRDFVPFYRMMEDAVQRSTSGKKLRNPIKRFKGMVQGKTETDEAFQQRKATEGRIYDPIESIVKNTFLYVELAEKNRVMRSLVDLAAKYDPDGELVSRVKTPMLKVTVDPAKELAAFQEQFGIGGDVAEQAMEIFRPLKTDLAPGQIAAYIDGKRQIYDVGEEVATALNGMDEKSAGWLLKVFATPASMLRAGATLSLEFMARNITRDQLTAFLHSEGGTNYPFYYTMKGAMSIWKQDANFENWMKGGGAGAAQVVLDRKNIIEHVFKLDANTPFIDKAWNTVKTPSNLGGTVPVVKAVLNVLRNVSESFENATRVGEYGRVAKGRTDANSIFESAYASREATLDFARRGAQTRALNMLIPFFNAAIQGTDRTIRAMKDNPKAVSGRLALLGTASSLLWWANKNNPRMDAISDYEKDIYWHFPIDYWVPGTADEAEGKPDYMARVRDGKIEINAGPMLRIPKPQGAIAAVASAMERTFDYFVKDDPDALKEMTISMLKDLAPSAMPQFSVGTTEQFANYSFFRKAPLVPQKFEGLLPELQHTEYTSETAKLIGKVVGYVPMLRDFGGKDTTLASPMVIDNYLQNLMGSLGSMAIKGLDEGLYRTGVANRPVRAEGTWADVPGVRAFISRHPSATATIIRQFETQNDEFDRILKSIKFSGKKGDEDTLNRLIDKYGDNINRLPGIKAGLTRSRELIVKIDESPDYDPTQKRQLIEAGYWRMIEMARYGIEAMKDARHELKGTQWEATGGGSLNVH